MLSNQLGHGQLEAHGSRVRIQCYGRLFSRKFNFPRRQNLFLSHQVDLVQYGIQHIDGCRLQMCGDKSGEARSKRAERREGLGWAQCCRGR